MESGRFDALLVMTTIRIDHTSVPVGAYNNGYEGAQVTFLRPEGESRFATCSLAKTFSRPVFEQEPLVPQRSPAPLYPLYSPNACRKPDCHSTWARGFGEPGHVARSGGFHTHLKDSSGRTDQFQFIHPARAATV